MLQCQRAEEAEEEEFFHDYILLISLVATYSWNSLVILNNYIISAVSLLFSTIFERKSRFKGGERCTYQFSEFIEIPAFLFDYLLAKKDNLYEIIIIDQFVNKSKRNQEIIKFWSDNGLYEGFSLISYYGLIWKEQNMSSFSTIR